MEIDRALELVRSLSEDGKPGSAPAKPEGDVTLPPQPAAEETADHEKEKSDQSPELTEALRIVTEVALGRDPYTDDRNTTHRPEFNPETVRALCVVVRTLLGVRTKSRAVVSDTPIDLPLGARRPLEDYLRQVEKAVILEALEETHWNRTEAARKLGIPFRALRYKLESLGIDG